MNYVGVFKAFDVPAENRRRRVCGFDGCNGVSIRFIDRRGVGDPLPVCFDHLDQGRSDPDYIGECAPWFFNEERAIPF